MRSLLIAALLTSRCFGTLVITSSSPQRTLIGADGMAMLNSASNPNPVACKIRQGNRDCYVALLGLLANNRVGFDLARHAITSCNSAGSMYERAERFSRAVLPHLNNAWKDVLAHDKETAATIRRVAGGARTSVVFAGREMVAVAEFVDDGKSKMVATEPKNLTWSMREPDKRTVTGYSNYVDEILRRHPEIKVWEKPAWIRFVLQRSIEIETANPRHKWKTIGPPISILEITDNGPRWIEQGACPALK